MLAHLIDPLHGVVLCPVLLQGLGSRERPVGEKELVDRGRGAAILQSFGGFVIENRQVGLQEKPLHGAENVLVHRWVVHRQPAVSGSGWMTLIVRAAQQRVH